MTCSVLLATDGTTEARGATLVARHLAECGRATVNVIAVHEPEPLLVGAADLEAMPASPAEQEAIKLLRNRVELELRHSGATWPSWPLTVRSGPVEATVAKVAAELHSELIVVGLRQYPAWEHWAGREKPIGLMHRTGIPVLAIPASSDGMPSRIVVATDLRGFSRCLLRQLRLVAAPDATIHLVHVEAPYQPPAKAAPGDWIDRKRGTIRKRLNTLAATLSREVAPGVHIHIPPGDPAHEVLRIATWMGADLIAVGSHTYSLMGRMLPRSVASRIMRQAHCSVLIAPPCEVSSFDDLEISERELFQGLGNAGELACAEASTVRGKAAVPAAGP